MRVLFGDTFRKHLEMHLDNEKFEIERDIL